MLRRLKQLFSRSDGEDDHPLSEAERAERDSRSFDGSIGGDLSQLGTTIWQERADREYEDPR